jgi:hypothetical protein
LIHQSGFEASFRVPDFVNQGEELGDLAAWSPPLGSGKRR